MHSGIIQQHLFTIISVYSSPTNVNGMSRVTGSLEVSSPRGPSWSPSATPNGNKSEKFNGTLVEILEAEFPEMTRT